MDDMLSHDPAHKLHAAMAMDGGEPHLAMPPRYMEACRRWYAALSESEKAAATAALRALHAGDNARALSIAATLPAAPRLL